MQRDMRHELKTWPEYFNEVDCHNKHFEIRKNDRDFREGDILLLQEYIPSQQKYTGREIEMHVTYVLHGGQFGLEEGYVCMSICQMVNL